MNNVISDEKMKKYIALTGEALDKLKMAAPERSFGRKMAEDFLTMASSYYNDAKHFLEKGDIVNAFASVNYAHGWIDCGARIGLFSVDGDDRLFTLYE